MLTRGQPVPVAEALGLLERAVDYTRGSLLLVTSASLRRPTPCRDWDLEALLRHMDDSLAAFTDAAEIGYVAPEPVTYRDRADELVGQLRQRACALLGAWVNDPREAMLYVGDRPLPSGLVACTGALEVAVHGWDVARSCGQARPLPSTLARELLVAARTLVTDEDRGRRFGPTVHAPTGASPSDRLVAFLGRLP